MPPLEAAFYARVSGEQQADAQTIQSQIAALRERIASDEVLQIVQGVYSPDTICTLAPATRCASGICTSTGSGLSEAVNTESIRY